MPLSVYLNVGSATILVSKAVITVLLKQNLIDIIMTEISKKTISDHLFGSKGSHSSSFEIKRFIDIILTEIKNKKQ